ncbi:MAG: retroviral-like aspartic protease family protein [Candidatus Helarchaeota archaeon]
MSSIRIIGQYNKIWEGYCIPVILHSRKPIFSGKVEFLLDSGANMTVISEKDAKILKIKISSLKKRDKQAYGIGGKMDLYELNKVSFITNLNEGIKIFKENKIHTGSIPKNDRDTLKIKRMLPSILGQDFLKNNKLKLFVDMENDIAFLTDEEIY